MLGIRLVLPLSLCIGMLYVLGTLAVFAPHLLVLLSHHQMSLGAWHHTPSIMLNELEPRELAGRAKGKASFGNLS